jgi:iron complex outermembrane recepter protein
MARNFRRTILFCAVIGGIHATAFAQENVAAPATEQAATEQVAPEQAAPGQSATQQAATGQPATDAQQAPATTAATELDKVVVVGSRLSGNSETGMAPVIVLGEEDIADTGAVSGDELLQTVPQVGDIMFDNTDTAANINAARGDVGSINLRNLGTGNTLLLVNGRRVVPHPGTQTENLVPRQTGNMNAIPLYGIRRMETLLGGASALYGSDAVAGVVNVVMDTSYQGFKLQTEYGGSEDTDFREGNVNFKAGHWFNDGRTRVTLLGGYTDRTELASSERWYSADMDKRSRLEGTPFEGYTAFDDRLTGTSWGAFQTFEKVGVRQDGELVTSDSGYFHVEPVSNQCVASIDQNACIETGSTVPRDLRFNAASQRNLIGAVKRKNLFGTFEQDINDNFVAFGELSYYRSRYEGMREQAASLGSAAIVVPKTNYYNPFGAMYLPDGSLNPNRLAGIDAPEEGLDVRMVSYRATDTERPYTVDDESYRVVAGVRGMLGAFDWESAVLYSAAKTRDAQQGSISNTLFAQALGRSDPGAYNPFNGGDPLDWSGVDGTPNDPDTIASFTIPVIRKSRSTLFQVDSRLLRDDLFSLPAGDVGLAAGVEWRRETLSDDRDIHHDGTITYTDPVTGEVTSDILGASPSPDNSGERSVGSVYAEMAVPLVSPAMDVPLVNYLDLQLAGRWEHYSDFGSVAKPKVALAWGLADGLMMRASWSQSFLAPNIMLTNSKDTTLSNTRTDYYVCEADIRNGDIDGINECGESYSTVEQRSGNHDLQPETAEAWSAGFVFQPTFLSDRFGELTLTADYWSIKQEDVIGILGGSTQLALDYLMRMQGSFNPAVIRDEPDEERIAQFEGTGLEPVGRVNRIEDTYINRLPRTARGLDFSASWRLETDNAGTFNVQLNAARLIQLTQELTDDERQIIDAQQQGIIDDGFSISEAGNLVGLDGTPEWRASLSASWRINDWKIGTFTRYTGAFDSTSAELDDGTLFHVPSWSQTNVYLERRFRETGNFLEDSSIRFTVRDVANNEPPLGPTTSGFYTKVHSARGRGYYLTLTKEFE